MKKKKFAINALKITLDIFLISKLKNIQLTNISFLKFQYVSNYIGEWSGVLGFWVFGVLGLWGCQIVRVQKKRKINYRRLTHFARN